ncbi:DUF3189 family protein [Caldalkalibacillus salinus]|uniref:DUF3189 family protein n=1 Tax=Caldalkalibacillus salinus TaxID=2803787 RepID=UPI001920ECE6
MNLIYYCYGSAHSSIVAAAIHLGHLPDDRVASVEDILSLPDFDISRNDSLGHLFFKGVDHDGHNVYTIGLGPERQLVQRSIASMIDHLSDEPDQFLFAQALPHINRMARIGGALSRRYGCVKIGRYVAAKGVHLDYKSLLSFVKDTKKKLKNKISR